MYPQWLTGHTHRCMHRACMGQARKLICPQAVPGSIPCAHRRDTQWHRVTYKKCALILQGICRTHGIQHVGAHIWAHSHRAHAPYTRDVHTATHHSTLHTHLTNTILTPSTPSQEHTMHTEHPCDPHDTHAKHTSHIKCPQDTHTLFTQHTYNAHIIYMHATHIQYMIHLLNIHASCRQHTVTHTHTHTTHAIPE